MLFHWLLLQTLGMMVAQCNGANILLLPFMNASHFLEMDGVGRPLQERGHNIYVLFDQNTAMPKTASYKLVTFRSSRASAYHTSAAMQQKLIENSQAGVNTSMISETMKNLCVDMMSDQELLPKLRSFKLDMVLLDAVPMPCFYWLPYRLGVPYVTVSSNLFFWHTRVPVLPSVVPPAVGLEMFGLHFCEENSSQLGLVRHLCRTAGLVLPQLFFSMLDYSYLFQYDRFPPLDLLRQNMSFALVNVGHLLSNPLPKLPNVKYVGGLTTRPARPLEVGLQKWMEQEANVVITSFGSMFGSLPLPIARKLFTAFGKLSKYRFLMRYKMQENSGIALPANVRLMDWLPQNDALGHSSTRAFITHSGNNGQQEALYHGVPMLCFYIHADQKGNAKRVADRGFGKMINIHDFTAEQLVADISDLMENSTYTERIKKASAIFHSEKHPAQRAADVVEHVLKFGAEHMKSEEAYALSWWEYYMLDALAVVYTVILLAFYAAYKLLKCLFCLAFCRKRTA